MPVQVTFDSQDAIPEALKAHSVEKDGKWVFEAETLPEVENLKKTVKKEREGRTKYESELKKFERLKPLTEVEEEEREKFLEAWEKRNETKGKPDPQVDETLKKLHAKELKKLQDQLTPLSSENEKLKAKLRDFELWTPLRDVAVKSGVIAEDWDLVRLDLSSKNQFGFDEDGKIVVLEDGHPSIVSPEKFFKEVYSDQRPKFYKASGAGGSGASAGTGNGASKTIKRDAFAQLSSADQMAKIKEGYVPVD